MAVFRRRLIFWLIKAYIKKSGKTLVISFLIGLFIFFSLLVTSKYFVRVFPVYKKTVIGIVGAYRQEDLPPDILSKLSRGLTIVEPNGTVKPDLAESWQESDGGKTYTFYLKPNLFFADGREVTADTISYNFSDVAIEKPGKYTIVFKLKEPFSPFLVTVSKPVFENGFTGVGKYRIGDISLNAEFVQSLTLVSTLDKQDIIRYQFYPSEEILKMAYLMGEISETKGLSNQEYKDMTFDKFHNTTTESVVNYSRLVTLFFNTTDSSLSDKKLRLALTYALGENYPNGEKAYLPYAKSSPFYNDLIEERTQDFDHAKTLLASMNTASDSATKAFSIPSLKIKTLKKYRSTADTIASTWKQIGIQTTVEEVDNIPTDFQIFLGDFNVPKDPDQYVLWHSGQSSNISKYKNLRIDKLLEDGRKTANIEDRKTIYADFQKYLMEDAPAAFLYFPTEWNIVRK